MTDKTPEEEEVYEGEPDFDHSQAADDGSQDDLEGEVDDQ